MRSPAQRRDEQVDEGQKKRWHDVRVDERHDEWFDKRLKERR